MICASQNSTIIHTVDNCCYENKCGNLIQILVTFLRDNARVFLRDYSDVRS
jgi:hypothetical protein